MKILYPEVAAMNSFDPFIKIVLDARLESLRGRPLPGARRRGPRSN